jgi:hypothetical protein
MFENLVNQNYRVLKAPKRQRVKYGHEFRLPLATIPLFFAEETFFQRRCLVMFEDLVKPKL